MANLGEWEKIVMTLDDDLRLIYPAMYLESQHLFDKIMGIGYLVQDLSDPDKGLDWVKEYQLNKLLKKNPKIAVLQKLLVVRLRLPWNEVETEWLVTEAYLKENPDEYEILETRLKIRRKGSNDEPKWLRDEDRQYFEENRLDFEIVEKRYSVRWKWSAEEMSKLLDESLVNAEDTHTYLAE